MSFEYSKANKSDLEQVISILRSERGDASMIDVSQFIVVKDKNIIIGCVRTKDLSEDCIELASLVVNFDHRNQGIGSELVRRILKMDKRRPIYLLCMKSRKGFYEALDFSIVEKPALPESLLNEYNRVAEKLGDLKVNVIAMVKIN